MQDIKSLTELKIPSYHQQCDLVLKLLKSCKNDLLNTETYLLLSQKFRINKILGLYCEEPSKQLKEFYFELLKMTTRIVILDDSTSNLKDLVSAILLRLFRTESIEKKQQVFDLFSQLIAEITDEVEMARFQEII